MKTQFRMLTFLFFYFALALVLGAPLGIAQDTCPGDIDCDGISDDMENSGWENSTGFYQTYPNDPDSDNDGLTDGEEQLFNTKPLTSGHPGIYARYDNGFQAKKYYSWKQYGSQ